MNPKEKKKFLKDFKEGKGKFMSHSERSFREEGGIGMLATRARGISTDNASQPFKFKGNQAAAEIYKDNVLSDKERKNVETDVGIRISEMRGAGIHMGKPSDYLKRMIKKRLVNKQGF
tara:strand:- start:213 stop:566 length:354 start_codon:yes stop_codon:yes gene_type:complete